MRRRRRSRASTYETSRKIAIFHPPTQPVALPQAVRLLGAWPEGTVTRSIPVELILEDPVFKVSQRSYFIQLADFCAYALLRRERPLASKTKYGLDNGL